MIVPEEWQCDCPEARLLRAIVDSVDAEGALTALASTMALWKLRGESWEVAATPARPYGMRYSGPPRTAEQIRAEVARSWHEFDQGVGPLHERR